MPKKGHYPFSFRMGSFGVISVTAKNQEDAKKAVREIVNHSYQVYNLKVSGDNLIWDDASGVGHAVKFESI